MRIHTNNPSMAEVVEIAANNLGLSFERLTPCRSRSHDRALDVILNGSSPRSTQSGGGKAATWDEWGQFLAAVYAADPEAKTPYYRSAEHFHWATGDRFHNPSLAKCRQHKWEYENTTATGSYSLHHCAKGCGAFTRTGTRDYLAENFPV